MLGKLNNWNQEYYNLVKFGYRFMYGKHFIQFKYNFIGQGILQGSTWPYWKAETKND